MDEGGTPPLNLLVIVSLTLRFYVTDTMKSLPFLKVIEVSFLVWDSGRHPQPHVSSNCQEDETDEKGLSLERIKILVHSEAEGGVVCGST